jgi:[ribosomal protein S18]-alanine N-acetyltransferase
VEVECRRLSPDLVVPLAEFFRKLDEAGDTRHFHPHPFTDEEAEKLSCYSGQDLYCVLVAGRQILGYGMLRGWDEGYQVPSLGIALHPAARGAGLGRMLMHFLHAAAKRRGAARIRLKVYPDNLPAITLYKSLGYIFAAEEEGQLVGHIDL